MGRKKRTFFEKKLNWRIIRHSIMPSKNSSCYSITFRPTYDEYRKYNEDFIDRIQKKFHQAKFILAHEKGNSDEYNHIQGFIEFKKDKRADTLRKTFKDYILKNMEISYPKVALKVSPISRDVKLCQGYTLKEQSKALDNITTNYDTEYLLECREYYLNLSNEKKAKVDKIKVNIRCFPEVFDNYLKSNIDKFVGVCFDEVPTKFKPTGIQVAKITGLMGQDGYYMLPLMISKDFDKMCDYIANVYSETLPDFSTACYLKCKKGRKK